MKPAPENTEHIKGRFPDGFEVSYRDLWNMDHDAQDALLQTHGTPKFYEVKECNHE